MSKIQAFSVFGVVAAVALVSWLPNATRGHWEELLNDDVAFRFLLLFTLGSMPIGFWMPRIRAGFFRRAWQVPANTYILPEWLVFAILAFSCGHLVATLVLAIVDDDRMLWIFGSLLLISLAFGTGAWHRLAHPGEEFELPWGRWYLRKLGWRLRK